MDREAREQLAAAAADDASFASVWAQEAERLRTRLAPSPFASAAKAAPRREHARDAEDAARGGAAPALFRAAMSAAAPPSAAASPRAALEPARPLPPPPSLHATPAHAHAAQHGAGPAPPSSLLRGLQSLADAGAADTPHGVAALADASSEARRGCVVYR
jgi:hypothetical protein